MILKSYPPDEFKDEEFKGESPSEGKVIAIWEMDTHESAFIHLYISEYESGKFWTIFEREDYLGTLSGAINFLNTHL